jgi:hypothetical protein
MESPPEKAKAEVLQCYLVGMRGGVKRKALLVLIQASAAPSVVYR